MNIKIKELEKIIEDLKNNESIISRSPSRDSQCISGSFFEA